MSKHMQIKDKVFEKLRELKGKGSWSDAIESAVEKAKSCGCPVEQVKEKTETKKKGRHKKE